MTHTSARLERRIRRDFGRDSDTVVGLLADSPHTERVQAAAVLWAAGDAERLLDALALADVDWRDTLMRTYGTAYDLASGDWEARLDAVLGPGAPVVLWRPTGPEELALVEHRAGASGRRGCPTSRSSTPCSTGTMPSASPAGGTCPRPGSGM